MKLASYSIRGKPSYGALAGEGIVDLRKRMGDPFPTLKSVLAAGLLEDARRTIEGARADYALGEIVFEPVVPDADKIFCVGLNYVAHREETGRKQTQHPVLFTRYANTQVGHGQPLVKPNNSEQLDYEGELAVVIGKRARHLPRSRALEVVAGYSCYHDGSVRDWQSHTSQFTPGKNFPGTGGFGPWLVTRDEIPDPSALTLVTRVNGKEMQRTGTELMIFDVPTLIEYLTGFTELVPGDVIATGTPGGVGFKREPPVFLRPGDVAEVEISRLGVLRNPVVAEPG